MILNRGFVKFLVLISVIALMFFLGRFFHLDDEALKSFLNGFPVLYSGIIFIILYVLLTFFVWFAKDILRLTAAVVFGAYLSTVFICIAETVNAFILFYLARYLGRDFVEGFFKRGLKNWDRKLSGINFIWLFLFRAVPLIPFRFLDLSMGLTGISFRRYISAVIIGSPLRIFWLQFILAGVCNALLLNPYIIIDYFSSNLWIFLVSFIYLILVIVLAVKLRHKD